MLCLLPLAAVALYGLGLRVGQYGWTIPRVWALYCGGLLALYALGYACRAAARGLLRHAGDDQPRGRLRHAGPAGAGADARGRPAPHRRAKPAAGPAGRPPGTARIPLQQHAQRPRPLGRDALRQLADGAASKRDPRIAQAAASALTGKYYSWDEPKTDLIAASPTFDTVPAGRQAPDGWWKFLVQQNPYVAQTCATASTTPPATVKQYERDAPCLLLFGTCPAAARKIWSCSRAFDNKYATAASKTDGGWQHLGRLETPPDAKRAAAPKRNGRWTAARSAPRPQAT